MIRIKTANRSDTEFLRNFLLILYLPVILLLSGCDRQQNSRDQAVNTPEPQYQGTIIAVGNSLTAGPGVEESDTWPALLEKKLQREGSNWEVINAGISGETSSGALSRIKWILAQKPDIVILETGANDGLRGIPIPVIRKNIDNAVQLLKKNNVTVILAGMQIVQNLGAEYTGSFAEIYPKIAEEQEILLIPFLLKDVAAVPSLNLEDTIHPNAMGHEKIAETVYPYVRQAILENR